MATLNLSDIIAQNKNVDESIEYGQLRPYLKSLYIYYKDLYCCEPVLMVTDIVNAAQYARIVPCNEFTEAICDYIGIECEPVNKDSYDYACYEAINFNSKFLKDLITK